MPATFKSLMTLDEKLTAAGFLPLTPWWQGEARRFYESSATQWVARVGRGGTKSTGKVKTSMNEVLFGDWNVPPGEVHFFAIVSENKDEAQNRLLLLEAYLKALRIGYRRSGSTIELEGMSLGWKVLACRIGAVSGFRAIGRGADEVAKWNDEGTDPSEEIMASMAAMTITHPRARSLVFSSPMGKLGTHYDLVERGDSEDQIVSIAPSWIANPSITEEQCRKLAGNERIFLREYAAIPQGTATSVFDADAIDRAMQPNAGISSEAAPILVLDASRGKDAFAWCVARSVWADERARVRVTEIGETPAVGPGEDFVERAVRWLTAKAKALGITTVCADQFEAGGIGLAFRNAGLSFYEYRWSVTSKQAAVDHIDVRLRTGTLLLPSHPKLRTQLLQYQEKIQRTGAVTYSGAGSHDDYAQVVITLAHALIEQPCRVPMVEEPTSTSEPKYGSEEWYAAREEKWIEQKQRELREEEAARNDPFGFGGDEW